MTNKTLLTINKYRRLRFSNDSAPDPRTIRNMINDGTIAGVRIGRIYYVEVVNKSIELDGRTGGHYHG